MRRVQDEIDLRDQIDGIKVSLEKVRMKIEQLTRQVAQLQAERDRAQPLPAWCDEPMYERGGDGPPRAPFLHEIHSVRIEAVLRSKGLTTRELTQMPHALVLDKWKNFGRKSLNDVLRALEIHGVRWPSAGRSD